jgi:nucleolar protein 16
MLIESRNQKETLTQNYRRLGLTSRLNSATGGIEKLRPSTSSASKSTIDLLAISNAIPKMIAPGEARVERDPETGKILRVIHASSKPNPLNDPLNSDSEDEGGFAGLDEEDDEGEPKVVKMLEEQARAGNLREKRPRKQSEREKEWIERLVEAHGDNYVGMVRDRKLNPMQQTEADIRRRISKWRSEGGGESVGP